MMTNSNVGNNSPMLEESEILEEHMTEVSLVALYDASVLYFTGLVVPPSTCQFSLQAKKILAYDTVTGELVLSVDGKRMLYKGAYIILGKETEEQVKPEKDLTQDGPDNPQLEVLRGLIYQGAPKAPKRPIGPPPPMLEPMVTILDGMSAITNEELEIRNHVIQANEKLAAAQVTLNEIAGKY